MALIKCPECGQEISSTAGHCVHCGYSFVVCPDCGAVLQGSATACRNCGCVIKKAAKPQLAQQVQQPAAQNAAENNAMASSEWDNRFAEQNNKEKMFRRVGKALRIVSICIWAITLLVLYFWAGKGNLERASSAKSTVSIIKILIILDCIVTAVGAIINDFNGALLPYLFRNKILRENWDIEEYIKEHSDDTATESALKTFKASMTAAYWINNPKACRREFVKSTINAVLEITAIICAGIFLAHILDVFAVKAILGEAFKWKDLKYDALIAAGVFFGALLVNMLLFAVFGDNGMDKWLEKVKK